MTHCKRIMIFGIPGSGKSTFALRLSRKLHLPLHHLDRYFFTRNWVERDYQEFLKIQQNFVDQESWIIDGNSTRSLEMRYARADLVLYFQFNRLLCLWRMFKRLFSKNPHISDRAEGCAETFSFRLIRYLWNFNKRVEKTIPDLRRRYPHVRFQIIRNAHDLDQIFNHLTNQSK